MIYFPQGFHRRQSLQITITVLLDHWEIVSEMNLVYPVCVFIDSYITYSPYLICISAVPPPNGHLVNVTHTYTSMDSTTSSSRNAKPAAPKKKATTMLGNIILKGITCVESTHNLHTQFAPGVHSGPPFKLLWSGSMCVICYLLSFISWSSSAVVGKAMHWPSWQTKASASPSWPSSRRIRRTFRSLSSSTWTWCWAIEFNTWFVRFHCINVRIFTLTYRPPH